MKTAKENFRRTQVRGIYAYTVACVGLFQTIRHVVRLRSNTQYDNARNIARQHVPGMLSYNVEDCERE